MSTPRLYRGQSKDYRCCPLVPTAMRSDNIQKLRNNSVYVKLISKYSDFKIEATTKWYSNIMCTEDRNPFEDYFLSLVNLCITIKRNSLLRKFCKMPFFTDTQHNIGTLNCCDAKTIKRCYNYAKAMFKPPEIENASAFYHDIIKEELSCFQHLNHVFRKISKDCPFPTMMLDWTESLDIAKRFGENQKTDIFSIDMKKCFKFFQVGLKLTINNCKSTISQVIEAQNMYRHGISMDITQKSIVPNLLGLYVYRMNGCTNQLMIDQCGVTIFWPWSFTPAELVKQRKEEKGLGYELDFKIESDDVPDTGLE